MRSLLTSWFVVACLLAIAGTATAADLLVTWPDEGTTGTCDASCTIEDALGAASHSDTIRFQANVTTLNRTYTLNVTKDVTIDGDDTVTLRKKSGASDFPGLNASANVTIDGLKVTEFTQSGVLVYQHTFTNRGNITWNNASTSWGAGIRMEAGTTVINHGTIYDNNALGFGRGGGIFNQHASATIINHGTISHNSAVHEGGGIWSSGDVINHGTISHNQATGTNGGGVYGVTNITNTGTIRNNSAALDGGGIWSAATVANSGTVIGNTAGRDGGGIMTFGTATSQGTVAENRATQYGGGVYVKSGSFTNTGTIRDNTATQLGGGVLHGAGTFANNGTILRNTALQGGGILTVGTIQLSAGTVYNNTGTTSEDNLYFYAPTTYNVRLNVTNATGAVTVAPFTPLAAATPYHVQLYRGADCASSGPGDTGGSALVSGVTVTTNATGNFSHTFTGLAGGTYVAQLHDLSGATVSASYVYSECTTVPTQPSAPVAASGGSKARCPVTEVHVKSAPPAFQHEMTFCRNNPIHSATLHYDEPAAPRVTTYRYEPGDLPDVPPEGWVASSYGLELTVSPSPNGGSITFKVPAEDVAGLDPSRLVVVHFDEGEWNAVATTIVDDPSSTLLVTMDLTGLSYSPFWLMEAPDSLVDADLSSDSSSEPSDESVAVPGPNAFALLLGLTIAATIRSRRALR